MKRITIGYAFCKSAKKDNKVLADYSQRGHFRSPFDLKVGETIHDFEVLTRKSFSDFSIQYAELVCKQSGIKWHHFDCDEELNSFALILNCQSCPHMIKLALQKMLLCGSKKFPIRNPLKQMTLRSFTPEDYTFVSDNHLFFGYQTPLIQDHKNLLSVTLETVLNPLMRQIDFHEVVWRYKFDPHKNSLEIGGDLAEQLERSWFGANHTQILNAIERKLLNKSGLNTKEDLLKVKYEHLVSWHRQIVKGENCSIMSHGDMSLPHMLNNFRKHFEQKQNKWFLEKKGTQDVKEKKGQDFSAKTIEFKQLQLSTPVIMSFKLENVPESDRVPLQILSYLLYDMPDSLMMRWNSPDTPYPKLYGYQETHFNIGITLQIKTEEDNPDKKINYKEHEVLQYEQQIIKQLSDITNNKFPNQLIQQCLLHLEGEYYEKDGMQIFIKGCLGTQSIKIDEVLNVKSILNNLMKRYRRQNVFEELLRKYILENDKMIRIRGKHDSDVYDDYKFEEGYQLRKKWESMKPQQKQIIREYEAPSMLQNTRVLPIIQPEQFQIFEERSPTVFKINETEVYHTHKIDGIKVSLKIDISDIEEEDIKLLAVISEIYPFMGYQGLKDTAYHQYLGFYIRDINLRYETCKAVDGLKIYMYLEIQFTQRNSQFGFNLLNNLVHDHNHKNISVISERMQRKGSEMFHDITDNIVQIHGRHIAGTKSPYAMIEDPIFQARSICNLAAEISKISNPKAFLYSIAHQIHKITSKFTQKNRIKLLIECRTQMLSKYSKYLEIFLKQFKQEKKPHIIESINDKGFEPYQIMKYFPNYNDEIIFETFNFPYYNDLKAVPTCLIVSALLNHNIRLYNPLGGCFLFKGALISYMRGGRKKYLELETYYKNVLNTDVNIGKRFVFQKFRRYTASDLFYSGIEAKEARIFKQAVAMTQMSQIQDCLHNYIIRGVKQGTSSMLALGPHLGDYEPLIKKGWTVERSVEDMSMKMEAKSGKLAQIEMSKYINIY